MTPGDLEEVNAEGQRLEVAGLTPLASLHLSGSGSSRTEPSGSVSSSEGLEWMNPQDHHVLVQS